MPTLTVPTILDEPIELLEKGVSVFTGARKSTRSQIPVLLKQSLKQFSKRIRWWDDAGVDFESYTTMDFEVTFTSDTMSLTHKIYEGEIVHQRDGVENVFNKKKKKKMMVSNDERLFALEVVERKNFPDQFRHILADIEAVTEYIQGTIFISCYLSKPSVSMRLAGYETYEVFSHGENVGDILKCLPEEARESFDTFMKQHFGFTAFFKGDNIMVNDGTTMRNVVYAGSSVWSQLVVGIQLWMVTSKVKVSRRDVVPTRTVVLEHPDRMLSLKAKLGLANAIREAGKEVHVMVETSDDAFAYMLQQA